MDAMPWGWGLLVVAGVAAVVLGVLMVRASIRATLLQVRVDAAANDAARLPDAELLIARSELTSTREARDATGLTADEARRQAAMGNANVDAAAREAAALARQRDETTADLRSVQGELQLAKTGLASAVSERDAAREALAETKAFLTEARVQMKSTFTEATSQVFDEKTVILEQRTDASAELSKTSMGTILGPFAEKVGAFQNKVEQLRVEQAKDHATLVDTIGELKGLNQNDAAGALTRALRGNAKTRGDWGELILETVLKRSGLEEGTNYVAQVHTVEPDLQTEAFERKVVCANPNTLMAMLRVVERLWVRDRIQRQVATISAEAAKLLDSSARSSMTSKTLRQSSARPATHIKRRRDACGSRPSRSSRVPSALSKPVHAPDAPDAKNSCPWQAVVHPPSSPTVTGPENPGGEP